MTEPVCGSYLKQNIQFILKKMVQTVPATNNFLMTAAVITLVFALSVLVFYGPSMAAPVPALTTRDGFVVVAPWANNAPMSITQGCQPPSVGTIPVAGGVILVNQRGGQLLTATGITSVNALGSEQLGFVAILSAETVTDNGQTQVTFAGPVPTNVVPQFEENVFSIAPDGAVTEISSVPTTVQDIQETPLPSEPVSDSVTGTQYDVPIAITNVDRIDVTNPETGVVSSIPLNPDVFGVDDILDANVVSAVDGTVIVTVAGPSIPPQNYEERTFVVSSDGDVRFVSAVPTTYQNIQQNVPPTVVTDPATNIVYAYDASQDALALVDVNTAEAGIIPVSSLPSLVGQTPAAFQAALQQELVVQDGVQYSANRIASTQDVQLTGVVQPNSQIRFNIYNTGSLVEQSSLSRPVRTIVIPNPTSSAFPFQVVLSNVAPADRYTYVEPVAEELSPQTQVVLQQVQSLDRVAVQQNQEAALTAFLARTQVAQPTNLAVANGLTAQREIVINPNYALTVNDASQAQSNDLNVVVNDISQTNVVTANQQPATAVSEENARVTSTGATNICSTAEACANQ